MKLDAILHIMFSDRSLFSSYNFAQQKIPDHRVARMTYIVRTCTWHGYEFHRL